MTSQRPHAAPRLDIWPPCDEFVELAKTHRVIPVAAKVLADGETPIGLYRKLAANRPGTFLLESADRDGRWSRYSIIGARSALTLTSRNNNAHWHGTPPAGLPTEGPILDVLDETLRELHTAPNPHLPPFTGGFVGYLGYDTVRGWENIPDTGTDDLGLPDVYLMLAGDLAVLDHRDGSAWLIANAINHNNEPTRAAEAWEDAQKRVHAMLDSLQQPTPASVATVDPNAVATYTHHEPDGGYRELVPQVQNDITAGEIFQLVLSQRFDVECTADAETVYRTLRASNPSPYMYLLRGEHINPDTNEAEPFDIVGSSPESLVRVQDNTITQHPIAGTRPRGRTETEDLQLGRELLADPKERAEHVMLVDLSRNDLGRICKPGTVNVIDFMRVERFSHVMHMTSTVVGERRPDMTAVNVFTATQPAGTLSGAPKVRAMELIDHYETLRRGLYGGVVGYLDFAGNLDLAIAIRTATIVNNTAYVRAGAGIVADSQPEAEHQECHNKARALIAAIAAANSLQ